MTSAEVLFVEGPVFDGRAWREAPLALGGGRGEARDEGENGRACGRS